MINFIRLGNGSMMAEVAPGSPIIEEAGDILDIMADVSYNDCQNMLIYSETLHPGFFDLKTGLAGEILQKFSNYRMKLAIIGDFSGYTSKSLRDFIRESNRQGRIIFTGSVMKAMEIFGQ